MGQRRRQAGRDRCAQRILAEGPFTAVQLSCLFLGASASAVVRWPSLLCPRRSAGRVNLANDRENFERGRVDSFTLKARATHGQSVRGRSLPYARHILLGPSRASSCAVKPSVCLSCARYFRGAQDLRNVGEIEKIRIGHDNDGLFPDWCLEEVQARPPVSVFVSVPAQSLPSIHPRVGMISIVVDSGGESVHTGVPRVPR